MSLLRIDGGRGEGGGQIVRTSIALSLALGRPVEIVRIRAGRRPPGLRPQHLLAVEAAAALSGAEVEGAHIGSERLAFRPGALSPGDYLFDVRTAGATTLILQTLLPPASARGVEATFQIRGGTHVPWSPPWDYLKEVWLPFLHEIGFPLKCELRQAGFYPRGGGEVRGEARPAIALSPIVREERGRLVGIRGVSAVAGLPREIAERQRRQVQRRLRSVRYDVEVILREEPSPARGSFVHLVAEFANTRAGASALGAPGKKAEVVGNEAAEALLRFLQGTGGVDDQMADQLLVPCALARGASRYTTPRITSHLLTNAEVVRAFLEGGIVIEGALGGPGSVRVGVGEA